MPIVEVAYYRAVCDGCGSNVTDALSDGITAWERDGDAIDQVTDNEGHVSDDATLVACGDCRDVYMATLCTAEQASLGLGGLLAVNAFEAWIRVRSRALSASGGESA